LIAFIEGNIQLSNTLFSQETQLGYTFLISYFPLFPLHAPHKNTK